MLVPRISTPATPHAGFIFSPILGVLKTAESGGLPPCGACKGLANLLDPALMIGN